MHKDVISPFEKLQMDAKKAIGANIQIISGHRSYERQLKIWNDKASGNRALLDKDNNKIDITKLDPNEIVNSILLWSAVPGASRHHWGTDIDIYDANICAKEDVKLTSSECNPGGPFEMLHNWLDSYLIQSDFFRPYATDKGGVSIEKWHLSFAPLSQKFYEQYILDLYIEHISNSEIQFKEILLHNASYYYQNYFRSIDLP